MFIKIKHTFTKKRISCRKTLFRQNSGWCLKSRKKLLAWTIGNAGLYLFTPFWTPTIQDVMKDIKLPYRQLV